MKGRGPSLARSFMRWAHSEGKDILSEVTVVQRRHRVVIVFKRFRELRGRLVDGALSIIASHQGESWDIMFEREVPVPGELEQNIHASREAMFVDHLFRPFRYWVLGTLKDMNCIEFVSYGQRTEARLHPDAEVPHRIRWERERNRKERGALAYTASLEELEGFDRIKDCEVEEIWTDFRTPFDHDEFERETLASVGPEGIAYLESLTEDDFMPFDMDELTSGQKAGNKP